MEPARQTVLCDPVAEARGSFGSVRYRKRDRSIPMSLEPTEIVQAREHLASFEKRMMDSDNIHHLSEGLLLLEDVVEKNADGVSRDLARNLGTTYASRICSKIDQLLGEQASTTEPQLEHVLKLLLKIDDSQFGDKERTSRLKVETVRRLFEEYFRGYTTEEKQRFVKKLLEKSDT